MAATGILSLIKSNGDIYTCTAAAITQRQAITLSHCANQPLDGSGVITMTLGDKLFKIRPVSTNSKKEITLLQIDDTDKLNTFGSHLDRTLIRDPIIGERIYFAHLGGGTQGIETTVCNVTESNANEGWFAHDCVGGPGSTGAMVIAVSDNALIGIHFLNPGRAIKLKEPMSDFQSQLEQ